MTVSFAALSSLRFSEFSLGRAPMGLGVHTAALLGIPVSCAFALRIQYTVLASLGTSHAHWYID